jgi:hypothetical protein
MTITPTEQTKSIDTLEPLELLIKEARTASRRRRLGWFAVFVVIAIAASLVVGLIVGISKPAAQLGSPNSSSRVLTCPSALVKLLGVSAISGGLGHAGLLVRASVTSSTACTMSGYPIIGVELTDRPTAMASDMRLGYLGGFANESAPLPRLSITSHSRAVSFTIQMAGCNARPPANAIRITLPGSRETLTARSMYEPRIGLIRGFGVYCGHLFVTPLVKGSSGNGR